MLTNRRKQFLEKIKELHLRTGEPVHYVDLADALGVSKWTAYDFVKALAKDGFVRFEYMKPEGTSQVGRARLGVMPNDCTDQLHESGEDVTAVKSSLLAMIADETVLGKKTSILELVQRSQHVKSRELTFIYLLVATLILLQKHSQAAAIAWLNSLVGAASTELALGGALGLALGLILNSPNLRDRVDREVCEALKRRITTLQNVVANFTEKEKNSILNFWVEAMAVLQVK